MYEVFPIGAGVILGVAMAGRGRLRPLSGLAAAGLVVAVVFGVAVSFGSGEWRNGVVYPLWDAFQAACAFSLSLVVASRRPGRRTGREED
jgi:hypothetical protein